MVDGTVHVVGKVMVWVSAVAAAGLTWLVRRSRLLPGEVAVMEWVDGVVPGARPVAHALDVAFTEYAAPVVFAVLVVLAWWRWGTRPAVVFLFAGSLTGLTKLADLAARPRPTTDLRWSEVVAGEGGYPSGHVVYAVVVFGFLFHLVARYEPPGRTRTALLVPLGALVLSSGPARLIEVDHWPADVLAGYLLAVPLLAVAVWVERRIGAAGVPPRLPVTLSSASGP